VERSVIVGRNGVLHGRLTTPSSAGRITYPRRGEKKFKIWEEHCSREGRMTGGGGVNRKEKGEKKRLACLGGKITTSNFPSRLQEKRQRVPAIKKI